MKSYASKKSCISCLLVIGIVCDTIGFIFNCAVLFSILYNMYYPGSEEIFPVIETEGMDPVALLGGIAFGTFLKLISIMFGVTYYKAVMKNNTMTLTLLLNI